MKNLPKPSAVIFDWDHTISNPDGTIFYALEQMLKAMDARGLHLQAGEADAHKPDFFRTDMLRFIRESFTAEHGEAAAEDALQTYLKIFRDSTLTHTKFMPGALRTLQSLEKAGIPVAIVSKKYQATLVLEHGHLTKGCFGDACCVLGNRPDAPLKPDPAAITEALDILGIPADQRGEKVWMVGDTYDVDVAVGKAAGCTTIYFGQPDAQLLASDPDLLHVANHSQLLTTVRNAIGPLFERSQ